MTKTTPMPSAQSCADKMAYSSFVSQIKCKLSRVLGEIHLPMKMKAGHFFRMVGIFFLLSVLLVACQGGCGTNTSSTKPATASTGANPTGNRTGNPGGAQPTNPGGAQPGNPGSAQPGNPGSAQPGNPGSAQPGNPGGNPPPSFASGTINAPGIVSSVSSGSSMMSMSIQQTLPMHDGSLVVTMPDGNTLSMIVTSQTDLSDFDDGLPGLGTPVMVEAIANPDGSFTAAKLKHEQPNDPNSQIITYQGVTTSTVGADDVIHFQVGFKSYTFTIPSSADLQDFDDNPQAIQANQTVTVEVQFNELKGTVLKVGKASN